MVPTFKAESIEDAFWLSQEDDYLPTTILQDGINTVRISESDKEEFCTVELFNQDGTIYHSEEVFLEGDDFSQVLKHIINQHPLP